MKSFSNLCKKYVILLNFGNVKIEKFLIISLRAIKPYFLLYILNEYLRKIKIFIEIIYVELFYFN